MEKFTQFRDPATGLHPFLHVSPPRSAAVAAARGVLGVLLFLVKAPLFAVVACNWVVFHTLVSLVPVAIARYWLRRYVSFLHGTVILPLLGVWTQSQCVSARRGAAAVPPPSPGSGDLVVCNDIGPVGLVVLQRMWVPTLTRITRDGLEVVTLWQALLGRKGTSVASIDAACSEARRRHSGPVVVFPEGTSSLGTVMLQWQSKLLAGTKPPAVLVGLVPRDPNMLTIGIGDTWRHVVRMLAVAGSGLKIVTVSKDDVPKGEEWATAAAEAMCKTMGIPQGKITAYDKDELLKYLRVRG